VFISRSVHARLQVVVSSGYDLCHPGWHTDRYTDTHRVTDSIWYSLYE